MTNDELFDAMLEKIKNELKSKDSKFWSDETKLKLNNLFYKYNEFDPVDLFDLYMNMMVECGSIDRLETCPRCGSLILVMFEKVNVDGVDTFVFGTRNDKCPRCHEEYLFNYNIAPWERLIIGEV